MPVASVLSVVIDCADPDSLASFWCGLLGGSIDERTHTPDWLSLRDVPGIGYLSFQQVPEVKAAKNRLHLDLDVDDLTAVTERVVQTGGAVAGPIVEEGTNLLRVMMDPEGNEFCLIRRHRT